MSKYASQLFKCGVIPGSGWLRSLGINYLPCAATWRKLTHQFPRPTGATPCNSSV